MEKTEQYASKTKDGGLIADRRLYLVRAKSGVSEAVAGDRVVEEGDAAAGYLLACAGDTIPADQVTALGLSIVSGKVHQVKQVRDIADEAQATKPVAKPAAKKSAKKPSGE